MEADRYDAVTLPPSEVAVAPPRTAHKRNAEEAGKDGESTSISLAPLVAAATVPSTAAVVSTGTQIYDAPQDSTMLYGDAPTPYRPPVGAGGEASQMPVESMVYITDGNGDEGHYDDDGGIIRCICGCDDDDGFTVQCDRCLVWQHCACLKMTPASLPDEYLCEQCLPRPVDVDFARSLQQRRRQDEARKELGERQAGVRRAGSLSQVSAPPSIGAMAEQGHNTASGVFKDQRARKVSQSEQAGSSMDVDYLSGAAPAATAAMTNSKSTKRRAGTSATKTSRRPTTSGPVPAPEPASVTTPIATPREQRPREKEDEDLLDAQDRSEAWQIEFTPIASNLYADAQTKAHLAAAAIESAASVTLRAFEVGSGKMMVPLADPSDEQPALKHPMTTPDDTDSQQGKRGLSVVGYECVPIEIAAASLADITQRATIRHIPEGVASGMFAQVQGGDTTQVMSQGTWSVTPNGPRPTMHGLYADVAISAGTFIAEYRGEIRDADDYRADPINQYHALGTSKPHVHILPPPLNIAIDARRYGAEARFARPSCHPNAVLRPILLRPSSDATPTRLVTDGVVADGVASVSSPELLFGIFAISDINRGHEITLGWEWDDLHIVHYLPELVKEPPRVPRRAVSPVKEVAAEPLALPYAGTPVAAKMDAVTSAICSVTLCACLGPASANSSSAAAAAATYVNPTQLTQSNLRKQDCALAQMVRIAHGMDLLQVIPSAKSHRKLRPPDFSPLVSQRRWWRPLPLLPSPASSRASDEVVSRGWSRDEVDSDGGQPMAVIDDGSQHTGSDDEELDRRSEASSLTEPLSEPEHVSAETKPRALAQDGRDDKASHQSDNDDDRPHVLPLKKRVAGTRLKATFLDGDFLSDDTELASNAKGPTSAKHGGRQRTLSRSTRVATESRRRPLRSTLDSEQDHTDHRQQNSNSTRASKRRRDVRVKPGTKRHKRALEPSSPLSSLSSQGSLSSVSSENGDGGLSSHSTDRDTETDSVNDSEEEEDTSDSDSSDESSSDLGDRAAHKSKLQARARRRTANFRADIAALGDAESSSEPSSDGAAARSKVPLKRIPVARDTDDRIPVARDTDDRVRDKTRKRRSHADSESKSRADDLGERPRKSKGVRAKEGRKVGKEARVEERPKKKKASRTAEQQNPEEEDEVPQSGRRRKSRVARRAASTSASDTDDEDRSPRRHRAQDIAGAVEHGARGGDATESLGGPPMEPSDLRASLDDGGFAPTHQGASSNIQAEQQVTKMDLEEDVAPGSVAAPPKPEVPRKKLSLADYKKRLAEKKVAEPLPTPTPASEHPDADVQLGAGTTTGQALVKTEAVLDQGPLTTARRVSAEQEAEPSASVKHSTAALTPNEVLSGQDSGLSGLPEERPITIPSSTEHGRSRRSSPVHQELHDWSRPAHSSSGEPSKRSRQNSRWDVTSPERPPQAGAVMDAVHDTEASKHSHLETYTSSRAKEMVLDKSPPRYGGELPKGGTYLRDGDLARYNSTRRSYQAPLSPERVIGGYGIDRSRGSFSQAFDNEQGRFDSSSRSALSLTTSPESARYELGVASRAGALGAPARGPHGVVGSASMSSANVQPFNPPRGPRALMGSSIMPAPPPLPMGSSTAARADSSPAASTGTAPRPHSTAPVRGPGLNAVSTSPVHTASGANRVGSSTPATGSGWTRISTSNSHIAPNAAPVSSGAAHGTSTSSSHSNQLSERVGTASTVPGPHRADLMNFDGVPTGPASMRGESSGSSSYDDYEYFGGRERGRGGWRGPRVRKRGGGRGRGWSMRS